MENTTAEGDVRAALYSTILSRRDVRDQFLPDPVPDAVLSRILTAAHHAPSVGFMQPWNFIIIKSIATRKRIKALFDKADAEAAQMFQGTKQTAYRNLKLEGILDAPLNLCITCDRDRGGPVVLGRTHMPETDLYSTVCAVQNIWLAARTEGLGVGWVSILDQNRLRQELGIPDSVVPVAYLCLGYVSHFPDRPELEEAGWRRRLPLDELIAFDHWDGKPADNGERKLLERLRDDQAAIQAGTFVQTRLNCDKSSATVPVDAKLL
jgi:5,6-dimethylbenzimidazole synthase